MKDLIKYSLNESYNEDLARIEKLNEKGFKKTKNFYSDTCKRLKNEILSLSKSLQNKYSDLMDQQVFTNNTFNSFLNKIQKNIPTTTTTTTIRTSYFASFVFMGQR